MLNRHATSKINIQNAIKTQGQAGMIIRKCNHKHQTRLIARRRFLISGLSVSPVPRSGHAEKNNVKKMHSSAIEHYLYFISTAVTE